MINVSVQQCSMHYRSSFHMRTIARVVEAEACPSHRCKCNAKSSCQLQCCARHSGIAPEGLQQQQSEAARGVQEITHGLDA